MAVEGSPMLWKNDEHLLLLYDSSENMFKYMYDSSTLLGALATRQRVCPL